MSDTIAAWQHSLGPLHDCVHWACFLAEAAVDALGHVDVIPAGRQAGQAAGADVSRGPWSGGRWQGETRGRGPKVAGGNGQAQSGGRVHHQACPSNPPPPPFGPPPIAPGWLPEARGAPRCSPRGAPAAILALLGLNGDGLGGADLQEGRQRQAGRQASEARRRASTGSGRRSAGQAAQHVAKRQHAAGQRISNHTLSNSTSYAA